MLTHTYTSNPRKGAGCGKGVAGRSSHLSPLSTGRGALMRKRKDPWVLCTKSERLGLDFGDSKSVSVVGEVAAERADRQRFS